MSERDKLMTDTPKEIRRKQLEMMKKLSPDRRIELACEMFQTARDLIIASLPKDLSEEEFKRQLYFRTYGEHLPEDFFERK
jgi:hypothetical protein